MKLLTSFCLLLTSLTTTIHAHDATPNVHTKRDNMKIPNQTELLRMANSLSTNDTSPSFSRVSPNVTWDVLGTHQAAGHYTSLASWKKNALGEIQKVLDEPLRLSVRNVIGGRPQNWAVLELEAHSECLNGLPYDQDYAWVMRFNEEGIIVHVRAYLDSALVQRAIEENT
ncbi:hypothetical protein EJ03DRAFT_326170 [Teratosphaeria nubilosa]|uniref:SnoaL-like domain-containing protein n=1 Tax=Teratosphaeria nubilosa TaxID=161662 RepID=A0A6G1LDA0_9PEZI|nr:hypothetical protein EJ03DRAFT_326170 [Teratosphaeria nubilosa]